MAVNRRPTRADVGALVIGAAGLVVGASSCRTPTQATIEIASEIAYRPDMTVSVQLGGTDDVESATPRVVAHGPFAPDGTVGTVVAVPRGDEEAVFAVRVVLAIGRDPATCSAANAKGCVVVRRTARFAAHDSSRLRVVLRPTCLGTFCDRATSCARDGACGSLETDQEVGDGGAGDDAKDSGTSPGADPYAVEVLADRPRHFYRFDEPAGSRVAIDATGRAHGTYEGGVLLGVTGALASSANPGAYFDGRDGSVVVPKLDDLPGAASFEAWVRSDSASSDDATVFERLDRVGGESFGYRFSKPPETLAAFAIFRGSLTARAAAPAVRFAGYSHVVAVALRGEIRIYVNGRPSETATFADGPPAPVLAPFVVAQSRSGGGPWRGAIDELAIYDYPLSAEQIARHRNAAGEKLIP